MASRLNMARAGALVLAASAALLGSALPAAAAQANAVTGTVNPSKDVHGLSVYLDYTDSSGNATQGSARTDLISLALSDGTVVSTYCVELNVELDPSVGMTEVPWQDYPNKSSSFEANAQYINWDLHNSYPFIQNLSALSTTAGTPTTLSVQEAIAGTQAAIWHYSDGATLDPGHSNVNDPNVRALYKYLTGSANVGLAQPATPPANAQLSVSPTQLSGTAGNQVGPFTVNTNLSSVSVTSSQLPAGVKLTDAHGNQINPNNVVNGSNIYFNVPSGTAAGNASFSLEGDLQIGRLFIGDGELGQENAPQAANSPATDFHTMINNATQSLIVAQSSSATATASANWVAAPVQTTAPVTTTSSSLPNTGFSAGLPLGIAGLLIVGGAAFLVVQRRRKQAAAK